MLCNVTFSVILHVFFTVQQDLENVWTIFNALIMLKTFKVVKVDGNLSEYVYSRYSFNSWNYQQDCENVYKI